MPRITLVSTLTKKTGQHLSMSMNLLWRLLLNLPALSLIALPFLFPPLWGLHLLSWFLPVAMPAVVKTLHKVKTPHRGPNTCQKQTLPFSTAIHAKIFKINRCFIVHLPRLSGHTDAGLLKESNSRMNRSPHHLETIHPCICFGTKYSTYVFIDYL